MGLRSTMKKCYSLKLLIFIWVCCFAQKGAFFASDSDRSALLELKNSISDPFGVLSSWDSISSSDHCSWYGVFCDSNRFVIALNVTGGGGGGGGDFPPSNSCARISVFPLYGYGIKRSCSNSKSSIQGILSSSIAKLAELRILSFPFNELRGEIPDEIWGMEKLEVLDLEGNLISGLFPFQFKDMRKLRVLNLGFNQISGNIPNSLFNYTTLEILNLAGNQLNGDMPNFGPWFRNLKGLYLSFNQLTGSISGDIGPNCKNLESLELSGNYLTGEIPRSLGNCTSLSSILLYSNSLVELIPSEFGSLNRLEVLDLSRNSLSGSIPPEIRNCMNLHYLDLSSNKLTGQVSDKLPVSCMNLFDISSNSLSGPVPNFLQNRCSNIMPLFDDPFDLSSSYMFHFAQKIEKEKIPIDMNLDNANRVVVHNLGGNYFTGPLQSLPISLDRQRQTVYVFSVANNNISGPFPRILFKKCSEFSNLIVNISKNMITGRILDVECSSLLLLDASWNFLEASLPNSIGKLKGLKFLSLSGNKLTGLIPISMTRLSSLEVLDLSSNFLTGEIPKDLVNLRNLTVVRLNDNLLSGQIPFGLSKLLVFNASYNNLSGPSNDNHMFSLTSSSTSMNQTGFIEVPEKPIAAANTTTSGGSLNSIEIALISSSAAIFSVLVVVVVLFLYTRKFGSSSSSRSQANGGSSMIVRNEVTVFEDIGIPLNFENVVTATSNFNVNNCIGNGGFGSTYKAEIAPGILIAIKRLAAGRFQGLQQFDAEIKTLGTVRHPNLVTLIGYHASRDEMFLIYNYLSGGNLERFIQERSTMAVNWRILHKIALHVASALEYLHDQCEPHVLHRDVKPSNILLDDDLNAYLSDFGLARLLGTSQTHATTGVAGTFGYVAPEYALTSRVTRKADVYSYGVVLLELVSDKKALDPSFSPYGNGFNIVTWACMLLKQGRGKEFFNAGLWESGPQDDLVRLLHLAVQCTVDNLSTRPMMNFVVRRLKRLQPPNHIS